MATASRVLALLALALTLVALTPGAATPARRRSTPVIDHAGRRPARFCPDNRTCVTGMHWSVWSATRAIGVGRMTTCPGGGTGPCATRRQTITYWRARELCGVLTFTRFRYQYWPARGVLEPSGPGLCLWYDR